MFIAICPFLRAKLTNESQLPDEFVTGARAPWLQAGGDLQFRAMYSAEYITYDSSLVLPSNSDNGGYWPFTFEYNDGVGDLCFDFSADRSLRS